MPLLLPDSEGSGRLPQSAWRMDCWDVVLIISTFARQDILKNVVTPGAGDLWIGIAASSVVGPWIAVETMQMVGIDLWVCLVVIPASLHHPLAVAGGSCHVQIMSGNYS